MFRFLILAVTLFCLTHVTAQAQTIELDAENQLLHHDEADLWLDTVFGHCLFNVAGESFADHPAALQGEWGDLRADYASTLLKPLNDPKQSDAPSGVILDLTDDKASCWTQYSSLVPDYAAKEFGAVWSTLLAEDRLKVAIVDQGAGPLQVNVILIGESRTPVIFYQSASQQGQLFSVVTIVQKTVPDFVYSDIKSEPVE